MAISGSKNQKPGMSSDEAERIAIAGLQFIAGDGEQLSRFLALTGISPQDLRAAAGSPAFLSGVLDFFMGDEPTLLAFAAASGHDPAAVAMARMVLSKRSTQIDDPDDGIMP